MNTASETPKKVRKKVKVADELVKELMYIGDIVRKHNKVSELSRVTGVARNTIYAMFRGKTYIHHVALKALELSNECLEQEKEKEAEKNELKAALIAFQQKRADMEYFENHSAAYNDNNNFIKNNL